jgi:hypothetical protein
VLERWQIALNYDETDALLDDLNYLDRSAVAARLRQRAVG